MQVLRADAGGIIQDETNYVGAFDGVDGAEGGEFLETFFDFASFAEAGGVDQGVVSLVDGDFAVDGVSGGAGDFGDDDAGFAEDGVDEGGFAGVWAADEADFDAFFLFFLCLWSGFVAEFSQVLSEGFQEFVGTTVVDDGEAQWHAQAQVGPVDETGFRLVIVGFVGYEDDFFALAAQDVGGLVIVAGGDGLAVDQVDDQVGLFDGDAGLCLSVRFQISFFFVFNAACIDQDGGDAVDLEVVEDAVPGGAGFGRDDGHSFADEAVKQAGFTDIRFADDGDKG